MILKSAIITPDGTELESTHVHDFKMYTDKVTGKEYGIDGGHDYQRLIGDMNDCKVILITSDTVDFETIRDTFTWGTRGKDVKSKLVQKKLKKLSNSHIVAILETQKHISNETRSFFESELEYRKQNKIVIKD